MPQVILSAGFDDLRSRHVRLIDEASKLGDLHVVLWSDAMVEKIERHAPKFPLAEREYFAGSLRFVDKLSSVDDSSTDTLPAELAAKGASWVVDEASDSPEKKEFCETNGLAYHVIPESQLAGFPEIPEEPYTDGAKKVIVTGCYDWFHSGHVRFFEEASEYGDLHVVVGHDANIKLLKGEGHPMYNEDERRYMAGAVKFVKRSYVSSGDGWLDAEPEIERIKPDIYLVNEDGDKSEKSEYCKQHGLEYLVLKRAPKEGLPKRQSTDLRGF